MYVVALEEERSSLTSYPVYLITHVHRQNGLGEIKYLHNEVTGNTIVARQDNDDIQYPFIRALFLTKSTRTPDILHRRGLHLLLYQLTYFVPGLGTDGHLRFWEPETMEVIQG